MALVELVRTKTADGLRLDGALARPDRLQRQIPAEAFILIHGVGGSFYSGSLFEGISDCLLELGSAVLRVNTRGHGTVNLLASENGSVRGGAAFEVVDHCRLDLAAWIGFLASRGFSRIGLLGHSLGAIKAVYSQAHGPQAHVSCLVALSPPRLSRSAFQQGPRAADFLASLAQAKRSVADGHPDELITVQFPYPLLISAATFLDKYGDERYQITQLVDRLRCPTLFLYGSLELEQGGVAFAGLPEAIHSRVTPQQRVTVATLDGADHFYAGCQEALAQRIAAWLRQLPAD